MKGDLFRRLRLPWLDRREIEAEFDDELAHHLELRERELRNEGLEAGAARARARRDFGDADRLRSRYVRRRTRALRSARIRDGLAGTGVDVRVALRALRRRPAFSAAAILIMALGIGAPTTVLSLVHAIFFARPEHVVEPHRLVRVFRSWAPGEGGGTLEHADYLYYRRNATALSGLAAYGGTEVASFLWTAGEPGQLSVRPVSDNYFDVLGVVPLRGRAFLPAENAAPGAAPVAVVSHGFWLRALGGAEDVVGRTIDLNGTPFRIVGVMPPGFAGTSPVEAAPDAWVPIAMNGVLTRVPADDRAWWERQPGMVSRWLDVVGRVADGLTVDAARSNLEALSATLEHPDRDPEEGVLVSPQFLYRPSQEASLETLSRVLLAVVAIVLLVAAANVIVLLLSRTAARWEEIGIRSAIGAGRLRLVRHLAAESLVLGAVGGALGIALAFLFSGAAGALLPLPFHTEFTPSRAVLAAAVALTIVTSTVAGLVPAMHAARSDAVGMIRMGRGGSGGRGLRGGLVIAQVALSLVLLSGALLFTNSFWSARGEALGFDRDAGLIARVELRALGHDADQGRRFIEAGIGRLSELPGVRAVTTTRGVPFGGQWSTDLPTGTDDGGEVVPVGLNAVSPGYFGIMDIEIVAGRAIDDRDHESAERVVVINETLANRLWPNESALGKTIPDPRRPMTVVGVARDAVYYDLGEAPWAYAWLPVQQVYQPTVHFLVQPDGSAPVTLDAIQSGLRELEPGLAFVRATTMASIVEDELARYEVSAMLVGLFGLVSLVLMASGLYGVVAFRVAGQSREIGVRMALGADRRSVGGGVMASSLRMVGVGGIIGLVGVVALRGYTASLLYGVEATDPMPIVIACLTLLGVTAVASSLPARRAMAVDPVEAIRGEQGR